MRVETCNYDKKIDVAVDIFDPRTWSTTEQEYRIYTDKRCETWVVVDYVDYIWAIRWLWTINNWNGKLYARRSYSIYENGKRIGARSVYLHVEIMKRAQPEPPSPVHLIVDHRNGNSLICTRANLRWATFSMNSRNVHGSHAGELLE